MNPEYNSFLIDQEKARLRVTRIASAVMLILAAVFAALCVVFIVIGANQSSEYANADAVTATVTSKDISGTGDDQTVDIYVDYEYNGRKYENIRLSSTVNESSIKRGDTITVYLIESKPESPEMNTSPTIQYIFAAVFGIVAVLLVLMFIAIMGASSKSKKKIRELTPH